MLEFISDFLGQFFGIINIYEYVQTINEYVERGTLTKLTGGIALAFVFIVLGGLVFALYLVFRRNFLIRKKARDNAALVMELNSLNKEVMRLNLERDKILSMKVSQIGLNPNEISNLTGEEMGMLNEKEENQNRFFKLSKVDAEWADYQPPEYDNEITLPQICERFRNFACSKMGLYYDIKIIRLFLASFASTRLIILQGISGTGKTSLPYAFGKFLKNDAIITSIQPSWRDRAELFGYFNEFTKKYNETELLRSMYEATYNENIYVVILDEMNIARVEYYFAEMLSILEMPSRDEWIVDLVPSVWETDPKHLELGKLKLPDNMWYVGTANNDDSTFAITDKVYDRAMPIDINTKGTFFEAPQTEPLILNYKHLESMLNEAKETLKVSTENLKKVELLDDYVIEHFRLAFGNRIVKQLREFIPAFVGCGGTEIDGLDYVLARKVFRKFEALNLSFIRDEIDGLCDYLDQLFGAENMGECKEYLHRLQKLV